MRGKKCKKLRDMAYNDEKIGLPLVHPEEDTPALRKYVYKRLKKYTRAHHNRLVIWLYPGMLASIYLKNIKKLKLN